MYEMTADRAENPNREATGRFWAAIRFSIGGDLRFLSHHNELRLLARALTRAGWPVAYSQGFNPRPRLVLPLPRSVGTASACELAIVELSEARGAAPLHQSLAAALPPACRLQCVTALAAPAKPHPRRALYAVELEPEHAAQAGPRIAAVLGAEKLTVERHTGPGKTPRNIDIHPCIEILTLDGHRLSMWLTFVEGRTARPTEVLTALQLPGTGYSHRVQRVEVEWDIELAGPRKRSASVERKNVGQEEGASAPAQTHDA